MKKPRYPIYIPSKGRSDTAFTMKMLDRWDVPYYVVVEPQEIDKYRQILPSDQLLELPRNDPGLIWVRNWILDHAKASGTKRHWQIDDNIFRVTRVWKGKRIPCDAGYALSVCEDFTDRYANVPISGLCYEMFANPVVEQKPFRLNAHVYSCTLIANDIKYRFRQPANEDVDMCLQVLTGGECTIQFVIFLVGKKRTMSVAGGQTDAAYKGDGRLFMARALERKWPGLVTVVRKFGKPQHSITNCWKSFDTKLIRSPDYEKFKVEDDLEIVQVRDSRSGTRWLERMQE